MVFGNHDITKTTLPSGYHDSHGHWIECDAIQPVKERRASNRDHHADVR